MVAWGIQAEWAKDIQLQRVPPKGMRTEKYLLGIQSPQDSAGENRPGADQSWKSGSEDATAVG